MAAALPGGRASNHEITPALRARYCQRYPTRATLNMLTIAISKGRMQDATLALFARAGISASEEELNSRRLLVETVDRRCQFIFVKPADVPTYVEYGAADAGICGRDVLL